MRIAIIDDGVCIQSLKNPVQCFCVQNGQVIAIDKNFTSEYSHGTICAKLIEHNITGIELISIAIYPENDYGNEEDLCVALEWCINNNIDVINLSNGSYGYFENEQLNELCYQNYKNGTYVIAAINNNMIFTTPAHLPYVIGVSNNLKLKLLRKRIIKADAFKNGVTKFKTSNDKWRIGTYSSFSCARFSNRLIRCLISDKKKISQIGISNRLTLYDFSLLKDLVSMDDELLMSEYGFSPCEQHIKHKSNNKLKNLIAYPQISVDKTTEFIKEHYNELYSVIWCGKKIPNQIKKICKSNYIKYWDESIYKLNIGFSNKLSIAEPIITIRDDGDAFCLASEIKKQFSRDGYKVLLFSEKKFSYLYGAIYTTNLKHIQSFCEEFEPDIAIVISNSDDIGLSSDLFIYSENNHYYICTENGRNLLPAENDAMYKTILAEFGCDKKD